MSTLQRKRHDSGVASPATSNEVSPTQSKEQLDGTDQDEWNQLRPFLSAPTTPRNGKKKCHFADTPPEDIDFGPRRTKTAPGNLSDLSLPDTRHERAPLLDVEAEAEAEGEDYRVLLGVEPESTSGEQQSDNGEPQEDEYSNFYDVEVEGIDDTHQSSSEEELPHVSPDTGTPFGMQEVGPEFAFKLRKPRSNTFGSLFPHDLDITHATTKYQRSSSLSALYSRPTEGPIIKTSAAAAATSNVDAHGWNNSHEDFNDNLPMSRSNTMINPTDDVLPTTWEEESPEIEGENSSSSASSKTSPSNYSSGSKFPLEKIKTRLSALSRSKGQEDTVKKRRSVQESGSNPEEIPVTPPNTRKPSHSAGHGNGKITRKDLNRSGGSSPPLLTPSIESPASSIPSSSALKPVLKQGGLSRQFGALSASDRFAYAHRDSIELAHHRLASKSPVLDPLLSSARDSMILAKQRFDKYPKSQVIVDDKTGQVKFGGLSPIMDASPPDMRAHFAIRREEGEKHERQERELKWKKEIGGHPENDDDCPICEVERPRARRVTLGS